MKNTLSSGVNGLQDWHKRPNDDSTLGCFGTENLVKDQINLQISFKLKLKLILTEYCARILCSAVNHSHVTQTVKIS